MGLLGKAWGSALDWAEWLHPRGPGGRFANKGGGVPPHVKDTIDRLTHAAESFNPRTFGSDGQAAQYAFNLGRRSPGHWGGGDDLHRLRLDLGHSNHELRLGNNDPTTQRFVRMMEAQKQPAPDDLILTRNEDPAAFGLTPATIQHVPELKGKLLSDHGYSPTTLGSARPDTSPGPHIRMSIAAPKGTPIIVPGQDRGDRRVFLDRGQGLWITDVKEDGAGGYYVMAIAEPSSSPGRTPEPMRQLAPSGVAHTAREANVRGAQQAATTRKTQGLPAEPQAALGPPPEGAGGPAAPSPQAPQAAPSVAGGPPARSEPPVSRVIGSGPTPNAPSTPAPAKAAPPAGAPEAPGGPDLRAAVREAGVSSPASGAPRVQWNAAYLGVQSGRKHPEDAVRELDADISHANKHGAAPGDIKALEGLRDVIAKQHGLPPRPKSTEARVAPAPPEPRLKLSEATIFRMKDAEIGRAGADGRIPPDQAAKILRERADGFDQHATLIGLDRPDAELTGVQVQHKQQLAARSAELRKMADGLAPRPGPAAKPTKAAPAAAPEVPTPSAGTGLGQYADSRDKIIHDQVQGNLTEGQSLSRLRAERDKAPTPEAKQVFDRQIQHLEAKGVKPEAAPEAPAGANISGGLPEKATIAELRQIAKDRGIKIPSSVTRKADIRAHIESGAGGAPSPTGATKAVKAVKAVKPTPTPGEITDKTTIAELRQIAKDRGIKIPSSATRKADIRAHIEGGAPGKSADVAAPGSAVHVAAPGPARPMSGIDRLKSFRDAPPRSLSETASALDRARTQHEAEALLADVSPADVNRIGATLGVRFTPGMTHDERKTRILESLRSFSGTSPTPRAPSTESPTQKLAAALQAANLPTPPPGPWLAEYKHHYSSVRHGSASIDEAIANLDEALSRDVPKYRGGKGPDSVQAREQVTQGHKALKRLRDWLAGQKKVTGGSPSKSEAPTPAGLSAEHLARAKRMYGDFEANPALMDAMAISDLRSLARTYGLPQTGSKETLLQRLGQHLGEGGGAGPKV